MIDERTYNNDAKIRIALLDYYSQFAAHEKHTIQLSESERAAREIWDRIMEEQTHAEIEMGF
jgi:hypothetical protein